MRQVWKFPLELVRTTHVDMPAGSKVLHFEMQGDTPTMWALVDVAQPILTRQFRIVGTGHPLPDDGLVYIGTCAYPPFVWHLFEE